VVCVGHKNKQRIFNRLAFVAETQCVFCWVKPALSLIKRHFTVAYGGVVLYTPSAEGTRMCQQSISKREL
jgi:hypothetical protein